MMPAPQKQTRPLAGVWESDAPDGYVALIVTDSSGHQRLRLEISREWYSTVWVRWLTRWLCKWDRYGLQIVP